jgi:hypothetical protein|tara:strand:- start:130 stop:420 length:291 start_codon:yes stop_codon:yes gene_type:complete
MGWVILAVAIFVIIFIMILLPKALKGWNLAWGKGFIRIYYVLAFIGSAIGAVGTSLDKPPQGDVDFFEFALFFIIYFLLAIVAIKVLIWIFGAFKK